MQASGATDSKTFSLCENTQAGSPVPPVEILIINPDSLVKGLLRGRQHITTPCNGASGLCSR